MLYVHFISLFFRSHKCVCKQYLMKKIGHMNTTMKEMHDQREEDKDDGEEEESREKC